MAGDKVQINTFAFYSGAVQTPASDNTLLNDLLSTLVSGVTQQSGGKIGSGNSTQLSNAVSPNVLSFLNSRNYNINLPKAYLNWVLLDDQFKYVAGNMGALQVQSGSSKQPLVAPLQTMAKNGYLYIYVSNQSPQNVYFDDLTVTHTTGPLVQEQSYYPFGLQMAGISDKAMIKLDSKNKFNGGVELEEDYGVNLYSTFYRQYDPQIGRFGGVDCKSEMSALMSVYQFGNNNPVSFNDPGGDLSQADWNDLLKRVSTGDLGHGGYYSDEGPGGFNPFASDDQAFMYGAMNMTWGSDGGGGSDGSIGFAGSFEEALNRYNGGMITEGMAQEYQAITWGTQASNVTASSVNGGFNVGLTATSTGNSYTVFVSTQSIRDGMDFLADLYGTAHNNESNGLETAKSATEVTDMGLGFIADYLQPGSRSAEMLTGGSELKLISKSTSSIAGGLLGVANLGLTIADGINNSKGWQNHNTADVVVSTAETGLALFEVTSPLGWAFGVGMFVGNLISEHYTGKSITENLFDHD
jgi:RHS repeat-associated protein